MKSSREIKSHSQSRLSDAAFLTHSDIGPSPRAPRYALKCRLALALNARGEHQGARAEAERALALCPNLPAVHGALGVILAYSGRPKEGLAALETCIGSTRVTRPWSTV